MAGTYENVTWEDLRDFFPATNKKSGNVKWEELSVGKERVLEWSPPQLRERGIVIRVFTSIPVGASVCRGKGKDAIRVAAVDTHRDRGYIKSRHVKRITTWRKNLRKRVITCLEEACKRAGV